MMGGQMPQMPRAVTKGSKVFKKVKELSQIGDAQILQMHMAIRIKDMEIAS